METENLQYLRRFNLILADDKGDGLDFSGLKCLFSIRKADVQTPNSAEIRVYNVIPETVEKIKEEFARVVLQAGYESNFGVIFDGNIKQTRTGVENGTDTYIDIQAGDGDTAYNFAVVNTTLQAGSTQNDQLRIGSISMEQTGGVAVGSIADVGGPSLPRGKTMYGPARDYLRQSARSTEATWSVQDGKLQVVKQSDFLPGQAVVLNSKTGLIGTPEQTEGGITGRCLLNPKLRVGTRVKIDEKSILTAMLPDTKKGDAVNKMPSISRDGMYKLISVEFSGDTFGNDWYCDFVCIDIDETAPAGQQVQG